MKKKIVTIVLILAMLLLSVSTAFAKVGNIYVVKGAGLHLRTKPRGGESNADNIIASLRKGSKVVHLSSKGNWWKVRTASGEVGWVFNAYLRASDSSLTSSDADRYHVKCSCLNVRASATTKSKKIGTLKKGTAVNVIAVKNGWGKIKNSEGKIGYIKMKYVG